MSYDIYGNLLRRGHCEVHPHVHEEYPCSVCIQKNNKRNAHKQSESDHYEIMELEHWLELSQQRVDELEQRNNELAATVDRLLKVCELARDNYGKMLMTDPPQEAWKTNQVTVRLVEAIAATPQQDLNDVKRNVLIDAIDAHKNKVLTFDFDTAIRVTDLIKYANTRYPSGEE